MTAFVEPSFTYKKDLIAAVKHGDKIRVMNPTPWGYDRVLHGRTAVVGPTILERKWYACVQINKGYVSKVIS